LNNLYTYYKRTRFIENIKIFLAWFYSIGAVSLGLLLNIAVPLLIVLPSLFAFILFQAFGTANDDSGANGSLFKVLAILYLIVLALILALPVIPYYRLWSELRKKYKELGNFSNLDELPPKLVALVDQRIAILSQTMTEWQRKSLHPDQLRYLLERRNFTAAPSMISADRKVNLIFPLGFFKLISSDPEAADAILAHELAHFFQDDSNLLFKIRCYYQVSHVWENYFLLFLLNGILWGIPLYGYFYITAKSVYKACKKDQSCFNPDIFTGTLILIFFTLLIICINLYVRHAAHEMLLNFLYKRVLKAEKSADLFAMCVTTPAALKRFLTNCLTESEAWYALHPARRERIGQTEKYERLLK
jgi:hypothetical protein